MSCYPCPISVGIPFVSFNGDTVLRSQTVRLFGSASSAGRVNNFTCDETAGLSFAWTGDTAEGDAIDLGFANQALSPTLLLPPKSVPAGVTARFQIRVCYTENADPILCDLAYRTFKVRCI